MDNLRREEVTRLWSEETEAPETQEWREDLTPEEQDYVAGLDGSYQAGVRRLCEAILIRDKLRQRYSLCMIEELTTLGDCCRLRLRDGRAYLVTLDRDNDLKFQAVDEVC